PRGQSGLRAPAFWPQAQTRSHHRSSEDPRDSTAEDRKAGRVDVRKIAGMNIDYREWPPSAPLAGAILAYWRVAGDGRSVPSPPLLPDVYVEIVINLGAAVSLNGRAFHGNQPARTVVGLLETAIDMQYSEDVCTFGIRLHPARAAAM